MEELKQKYLERLSELFPSIATASAEIINLEAILNLPKGTEHFLTDIHGEYEAFNHVLKNGSGSVKRKIEDVFGNTISNDERKALATLEFKDEDKKQVTVEGLHIYINAILNKYLLQYQQMPDKFFENSDRIKVEMKTYLDMMLYGICK